MSEQKKLVLEDMHSLFDMKVGKFDVRKLVKAFPDARYYFIVGKRGCGKTWSTMRKCVEDVIDGNGGWAYIRRWREGINAKAMNKLMGPHNRDMDFLTNGEWNDLSYYNGQWTMDYWGEKEHRDGSTTTERLRKDRLPCGFAFALNTYNQAKGPDYFNEINGCANIVLDEVIEPQGKYIDNEWKAWNNMISTCIREEWKKDTKIFLLANPLSLYMNPIMRNMGITKKMMLTPGVTEIRYPAKHGDKEMSCVFVYLGPEDDLGLDTTSADKLASQMIEDRFFAFQNSKGITGAITGDGWEFEDACLMPPGLYDDSEVVYNLYMVTEDDILNVQLMSKCQNGLYYLFVYPARKVPEKEYYMTLSPVPDTYAIVGSNTGHPVTKVYNDIFRTGQVYYSDLATADCFHAFLTAAQKVNP